MDTEFVEEFRRPEYTGENRCIPCTILNLAIAAAVGLAIARRSSVGGAVVTAVSIAVIYFRGYLVPGTPTLTKRYLPPAVLRWFGKDTGPDIATGFGSRDGDSTTAPGDSSESGAPDAQAMPGPDGVDVADESAAESGEADVDTPSSVDPEFAADDLETFFLERDVLEPCADRDDLCLTEPFEDAWLAAIETVDERGLDAAAAIDAFDFDADPDAFALEARGDAYVLAADHGPVGRWPSRAALLADVAASHVLADWTPDWETIDSQTRGQVLNGLRMFLETCPGAGGEISMTAETVDSCCTSHEVVAVVCDETGDRLFEQRVSERDT